MSMDIIGSKGVNSSSYAFINNSKNETHRSEEAREPEKNSEKTKALATDEFVRSTEQKNINLTYKPLKKKLSPEEVKALKDEQENQKANLIRKFIKDTINSHNKLLGRPSEGEDKTSKETSDLLTKIFGSVENAYPPISTTAEEAEKAIGEGGPYSVEAVADRIMTMATYIAGDDPNKLQQMREAVEKGFSQAGMDFNNATKSDLPQISKDTITEVMRRFDELQSKTSSSDN